MSRYCRQPYSQNTIVAAAVPQHPQLRNPWISEYQQPIDCRESQSTNSSSSSRTYRGGGNGAPHVATQWIQQPNHALPPRHIPADPHQIESIVDGPLLHPSIIPAVPVRPQHLPHTTTSRAGSDRPVTPASSPGEFSVSGGGVDGCGGHCVAFDNFCYYCLQVVFIAGILTGISLVIAGFVLRRQQKGRDLAVLVYIGCLILLVCIVLLSVQSCVRRNVKQRKRALWAARDRARSRVNADIPLQDLGAIPTVTSAADGQQYQPLLMRLVQQHPNVPSAENQRHSGILRPHPHYQHHHLNFKAH